MSHGLVTVLFSHSIMNLFGVLKYKKMGEDFLQNSGIPFTIIRHVEDFVCFIPEVCLVDTLTNVDGGHLTWFTAKILVVSSYDVFKNAF